MEWKKKKEKEKEKKKKKKKKQPSPISFSREAQHRAADVARPRAIEKKT